MKIQPWEGSAVFPDLCDTLLTWRRSAPDTRELPWRDEPTPYHVWISEIMLQQTRANVVRGYYLRFLAALPTVRDLADVDEDALMKLWQGLGYYSRARNLRRAAQAIVETHGGALPNDFDALLTLPGIGRYTASAISSFAYGRPCPAVDGNFLRVAARVTANPIDIAKDASKRALEESLRPCYPTGKDAGLLNEAFMDLGATVCLPNGAPLCHACVFVSRTTAARRSTIPSRRRSRRGARNIAPSSSCAAAIAVPYEKDPQGDSSRVFGNIRISKENGASARCSNTSPRRASPSAPSPRSRPHATCSHTLSGTSRAGKSMSKRRTTRRSAPPRTMPPPPSSGCAARISPILTASPQRSGTLRRVRRSC